MTFFTYGVLDANWCLKLCYSLTIHSKCCKHFWVIALLHVFGAIDKWTLETVSQFPRVSKKTISSEPEIEYKNF